MRLFLLLQLALWSYVPLTAMAADHPDLEYEVMVVRGFFDDRAMVAELAREHDHLKVDYNKNFVLVEVTQSEYFGMLKAGWRVEIDRRLTDRLNTVYTRLPGQTRGIDGFPCYRTVAETYADAAQIVTDNSGLATWIDIGDSWEKTQSIGGEDLRVLVLTNASIAGPKPKLFVMTAIHAREYTTAELNTRFAEYLVDNYGSDADATWLLDHHEVHLSLISNPDGRVQAQTGLSWRKNTNQNYCSPTSNSRGADLNRNFPFRWGCCAGSSGNPCSSTYRGPSPESEPETAAITGYVRSIFPDQRDDDLADPAPADATGIFLDVHSFSELVLWPWGFGSQLAPNAAGLQTLGRRLGWFNGYFPEQSIGLYPTDGTTDDFAYGELGVAAYTFELGTAFFQDCGVFESRILPDNLQALLYAAKVARTPYQTPSGPDTLALSLSAGAVAAGTVVTLDAVSDDTRVNNLNGSEPVQPIAAAEAYIDVPPWGDSPVAIAVSAADGAFDASSEAISAALDTAGLGQGRHTLFVRSQDQSGNWGPVSAIFFYIVDPATAPVLAGTVTAADSGLPLAAQVDAGAPFTTSTDGSGDYSLLLVSGTYDVTVVPDSPDYAPARAAGIALADGQAVTRNFSLFPYCDVFSDDVEAGNAGWTSNGLWTITDETANSPANSWTESAGGDYGNQVNVWLTSPVFDLGTFGGVQLDFASLCSTEAGYDYCIVDVSTDGGGWTEVARYDGLSVSWQDVSLALPQLDGAATAQVRFRFDSDFSVVEDGWHVDDIRLRGAGPACLTGDADSDGIADGFDNCTQVHNADQRDTNGDGIGNICDPDLNDDGTVNFGDLQLMKEAFFEPGDIDSDLNGDGQTNFGDLQIMKDFFFGPPGPAAP